MLLLRPPRRLSFKDSPCRWAEAAVVFPSQAGSRGMHTGEAATNLHDMRFEFVALKNWTGNA